MSLLYSSNDVSIGFDATTSGTSPSDWSAITGTWDVGTVNTVNGHTHGFGDTSTTDGQVVLLSGLSAVADMDVVVCQKETYGGSGGGNGSGVVLRSDSGFNNAYLVLAQQESSATNVNLLIFSRNGGNYTLLGSGSVFTTLASSTAPWYLRARCVGTTIEGKAWSQGTAEPTSWGTAQTDGSVTAAGYAGLYNEQGTAPAAVSASDIVVANAYASLVTVDTPAGPNAGASFTVTGTYTGTAPTAMDYGFAAIAPSWTALTSFSTAAGGAGGTWQGTATAPAAGLSWIAVRDHTTTTSQAASSAFTVSSVTETITVTTPGTQTAGSGMTVSGSYTAGPPLALDVEFDSAGWSAAGSPTISGGAYSFSVTAPAAGSHTVSVRDHNNTTVSGVSGSFTTASGATISVTTPSGLVIEGQPLAIAGGYTGTVPTGVNVKIDGGGYLAATGFTAAGGSWSASTAAPAFGSHILMVQEANNTAITATSGSFIASVAPNNAALVYSPYNWNVAGGSATSINAGAYLSTMFTGTACTLNFNVANMVSPTSEIWLRIDGSEGPWTEATVASTIVATAPASTAGNSDVPYHLLEMVVKSTTETQNRWNTGSGTAVVFTGLTLAAGAALLATRSAPLNLLVFGDSITEGVRTVGESASNDTDRNDAMTGWAYRLGALLGAEVGVVGFGATGLITAGSGNVPALPGSYDYLYDGVARSFSPTPDMVIFNEGTNDGAGNTVSAMTTVLNGIIAACPGALVVVLRPFNGNQATNLQAAIAACNNPTACTYIDTTGYFTTAYGADSLNLHPSGPNNLGQIAPQVAAQLKSLLRGSGGTARRVRGGFGTMFPS